MKIVLKIFGKNNFITLITLTRLDTYISEKFWFSRNKVQQFIDAGLILVNDKTANKNSQKISENDVVTILEDRRTTWVSRSAEKLFGFLENPSFPHLKAKVQNSICLDVGSSTGGFTQVLEHFWAKKIDAVDVGTAQLDEKLRNNPKIFSYENTDIRDFKSTEKYDFIVCDASFISLEKITPTILNLANLDTEIILLFKPQFEVGKNFLNKNGVPKNEEIIKTARENFEKFLEKNNTKIIAIEKSTLIGEAGNQEYIYYINKSQ